MSDSSFFQHSLKQIEEAFDRKLKETNENDDNRRFEHACSFLIAYDGLINVIPEGTDDNSIKVSDEQENTIRCIFARHIALVQPGDIKILNFLEVIFSKLQSRYTLQLILDIVPRVVALLVLEDDNDLTFYISTINTAPKHTIEDKVIDMLQSLLEKSSLDLISSIITCASSLTLSIDANNRVFEMIISVIPKMNLCDVPKAVQQLLRHTTDNNDARETIQALRKTLKNNKKNSNNNDNNNSQDPVFISVTAQSIKCFISAISSPIQRSFVAPAYISILEIEQKRSQKTNARDNNVYLPIDVVILSILRTYSEYKQSVDSFIFSWVSQEKIPFDGLGKVIETVLSNELLSGSNVTFLCDNKLSYNLIQLALLFFLSAVNVQASVTLLESIERFAFELFCSLDGHDRTAFVNSLFYFLKSTLVEMRSKGNHHSNSRPDHKSHDLHQCTVLSISKALKLIALFDAQSIIPMKHSILLLLEYPFGDDIIPIQHEYPNDEIGGCLSDLLVIILRAMHSNPINCNDEDEVNRTCTLLVSRMLSSESSYVDSHAAFSSQTWGIIIASKLYKSDLFSEYEKQSIKDMVIRLALSERNQMVDPQVGLRVLDFLLVGKEEKTSDEIFNYIKQILSRTGLIQRKQTNDKDTTVAGTITSKMCSPDQSGTKNYDIVYCVDFYSRNNPNFVRPQTSTLMVDWIFHLADTYLQLGREKTFWKADRWLEGSCKYPSIELPLPRSRKMQRALNFLNELFSDYQHEKETVTMEIDEVAEILSFLELEEIMQLKTTMINGLQSFLIAGALSAAVLRNTDTHSKTGFGNISFELIRYRLNDFYKIKEKSNVIQLFLLSLSRTLLRRKKSTNRSINMNSNVAKQSVLEGTMKKMSATHDTALSDFTRDVQWMKTSYEKVFRSDQFLPLDTIWRFVMLSKEQDDYHYTHKDLLKVFGTQSADKNIQATISMMQLRCSLVKHLLFLCNPRRVTFSSIGISKERFCFLLQEGFGTMDTLPSLCLSMSELNSSDRDQVSALISTMQSIAYYNIQLINRILQVEDEGYSFVQDCKESCVCWYVEWSQNSKRHNNNFVSVSKDQMVFETLADRFSKAQTQEIALSMLEFISLFIVRRNLRFRVQAIALSWTSLHTLDATNSTSMDECDIPYSFSNAIRSAASTPILIDRAQTFRSNEMETKSEILPLRQGILRHWGLVCLQPIDFVRLECDFGLLIAEVTNLLENKMVDSSPAKMEGSASRKRKQHYKISVVGLSEESFPLLFEWLLKLVNLTFDITPVSSTEIKTNSKLGPYCHLEIIFKLFQRLCNTYERYCVLFPKLTFGFLCTITNDVMSNVINLLHRCIEWRTEQPMSPAWNWSDDHRDAGSVIYLSNLFDSVSNLIVKPILSTAENLQQFGYQSSQYSRLRKVAQRAHRALQELSLLHLTTTVNDNTTNAITINLKAAATPTLTKSLKAGTNPRVIRKTSDSDGSEASSFGIDGNGWGDVSSDESNASLGLQ